MMQVFSSDDSIAVEEEHNLTHVTMKKDGKVAWSTANVRFLNWYNGTLLYAPMVRDYDFPSIDASKKVTEWQVTMASFLASHFRCFLCGEMGVSKTASAIWAADYLLSLGLIHRVLVVGRVSLLKAAWMNDLSWVAPQRKALVIEGSKQKKVSLLAKVEDYDFCLTNYEALEGIEGGFKGNFDLVIGDESTRIKNPNTALHQSFTKAIESIFSRWFLTGAPSPTNYIDIYGQSLALGVSPSYTRLPDSFEEAQEKISYSVGAHKRVARKGSDAIVAKWMFPFISVMKADVMKGVMEAPQHEYVTCPLSAEQVDVIKEKTKEMERKWERVMFNRNPPTYMRPTKGNIWNNFGQAVACGVVFTGGEVTRVLDTSPRDEALLSALKGMKNKAFVFVPYRQPCGRIATLLKANGYNPAIVQGSVSSKERQKIFTSFLSAEGVDVIIAVPSAIAHGVNGSSADLIVWYAPAKEPESYMQANERIYRYGQVRKMRIVHLTSGADEDRIYSNQNKTIGRQKELLNRKRVLL